MQINIKILEFINIHKYFYLFDLLKIFLICLLFLFINYILNTNKFDN
jgi:hypothetical protein